MEEHEEYSDEYPEHDSNTEELIENDEVSPEEEGFLKGYEEDESEEEKDPEDEEAEE